MTDTTHNTAVKKRRLQGVIASAKMAKTVVVAVNRTKLHPKYRKYYRVTTRFKAHSERNDCAVGDTVIIEETRPLSREKRWIVVGKVA